MRAPGALSVAGLMCLALTQTPGLAQKADGGARGVQRRGELF